MTNETTGVILLTQNDIPPGLVQAVKKQGGYKVVEVGFISDQNLDANLQKVVDKVIASGVERVILIPANPAGLGAHMVTRIEEFVADREVVFPETEFVFVAPVIDADHQANFLVDALRKSENANGDVQSMPLSALSPCSTSIIQRLIGEGDFISRLAALGFIPGSPVHVVQNFGVGPIIVSVRGGRLALGREEANKIRVKRTGSRVCRRMGHRGRRHFFKGSKRS
jgi:ferrous iron transport protein A